MKAVAVDLGGTHVAYGIVEDRTLLFHDLFDSAQAKSLSSVLATLEHELQRSQERFGACAGMAMGLPSIVDTSTNRVLSGLKKYEDASDIDLSEWCRTRLGLNLRIENDARMALLGEHYAGAGHGEEDLVMMTLGTGIGTAALLQGRMLRGTHFHAACLGGHLTVNFLGPLCQCGNVGCAESYASGWALPDIAAKWPGFECSVLAGLQSIGFLDLFTHAKAGDPVAVQIRDHCLKIWGATAVSLIHAYDPSVLILGGGVMGSAEQIVPAIQAYVDRHVWSSWGKPQVRAAKLGNNAALLGAVPLLTEENRAPIKL
ncbi:MAG TPA: ROK family protein [Acidobacteriaceae bacterium]|nr:ROK family protein [Acidobacteriaceae bacterium]